MWHYALNLWNLALFHSICISNHPAWLQAQRTVGSHSHMSQEIFICLQKEYKWCSDVAKLNYILGNIILSIIVFIVQNNEFVSVNQEWVQSNFLTPQHCLFSFWTQANIKISWDLCTLFRFRMKSMQLVIPSHFILWKKSFYDISRKCILQNMIRAVPRSNHIWQNSLPVNIRKWIFLSNHMWRNREFHRFHVN